MNIVLTLTQLKMLLKGEIVSQIQTFHWDTFPVNIALEEDTIYRDLLNILEEK